jgi:2-polyprenyl-6-hydroxyphenyl methylase/3-demethylubiquinone-9 3-methyltransferase
VIPEEHAAEVSSGNRFEFGANWARFLSVLDDRRIAGAVASLRAMLAVPDLAGKTFVDVGCGSGLFSLAAYRLGARVHSFDFDPKSVACTQELRRRYASSDPHWVIEEASALDPNYLARLGTFDVVYSWGVLHHTGAMWAALENIVPLVKPGGLLFIAIYNDQGTRSKRWTRVKQIYNRTSPGLRWAVLWPTLLVTWGPRFLKDLLLLRPFRQWREYGRDRGMSPWHDHVDWIGGYPFEVAKPEEIFRFYRDRGFDLVNLETCGGTVGCNQFVFRKALS